MTVLCRARVAATAVAVAVAVLAGATWATAQPGTGRAPEAPPLDPAYQAQLAEVSRAASAEVERERARRVAPFDLWWGVR